MKKNSQIILPVRFSQALYEDITSLAVHTERSRCGMVRKLVADGIRRWHWNVTNEKREVRRDP